VTLHRTERLVGRGPLVVAGIAVACLLGALAALAVAAVSRDPVGGIIVAVLLVLGGLLDLALLAIVLVRDPFRRGVLARLDAVERRIEEGAPPVRSVVSTAKEAPPDEPAITESPSVVDEVETPPETAPAPQVTPMPSLAARVRTSKARPDRERRQISWEALLGGRALGILGVVVMTVAIGLFLKFGWDQGWFRPSPPIRVVLGVLGGGALLIVGELARRRERYRMLAQILTAGGVSAIYVSAWAAHGLFHLVGGPTAFVLIAATAAFGVGVAVATNGRVVAILSTIGAFLVPVVVELPEQSPTALYFFLVVVTAAVLMVSAFRRWPELGVLTAVGVGVHTAAALQWTWPQTHMVLVDACFVLVEMGLFLGVALTFAWRRRQQPGVVELAMLAVVSLAGWGVGLWRLEALGDAVCGVWTLVVLLLEVVAAGVLLKRLGSEERGRLVFVVVAFLLLTAIPPVVWDGPAIPLGWAVEALALALAGLRADSPWILRAAAAVAGLSALVGLESLGVRPGERWPLADPDAVLRLLTALALAAVLVLAERRCRGHDGVPEMLRWTAAPAAGLALVALAAPESRAAATLWTTTGVRPVAGVVVTAVLAAAAAALLAAWRWRPLTATTLTGGVLLMAVLMWDTTGGPRWAWAAAMAVAPVLWAGLVLVPAARSGLGSDRTLTRVVVLATAVTMVIVAVAWRAWQRWPGELVVPSGVVPAFLLAGAALGLLMAARSARGWPRPAHGEWLETAGWVLAVAGASRLLASAIALSDVAGRPETERAAMVSLSVLWGCAGLALVLAGLVAGRPWRRWLGLALLGVTVTKVFFSDLASAATVIRIVAFMVTGAALIAGSFLYARFRERLEA